MQPLWCLNDMKVTNIRFSSRWTCWARTASRGCLLKLTISPMRALAWNAREKIALMRDASCCGIAKCAALIILPRILMVMGIRAGVAVASGPAPSTTFLTQNFVIGSSTSVWGHPFIGWSVWGIAPATSTGSGPPSQWPRVLLLGKLPQPLSWGQPALMKLGMSGLCYHKSISHNGACPLQPLSLEWAGPSTPAWLCSGGLSRNVYSSIVLVPLALWVELLCALAPPNKVDSWETIWRMMDFRLQCKRVLSMSVRWTPSAISYVIAHILECSHKYTLGILNALWSNF